MDSLKEQWLILISTPVYIIIIGLELLLSHLQHRKSYTFRDTVTNIYLMLLNGGIDLGFRIISLVVLNYFYVRAWISIENVFLYWLLLVLLEDFLYYWLHRFDHEIRLFWAVHVTHHSSQYFNLTVAGRVNFIFLLYRSLFWAPLCLFGIPPEMILLIESITAIPTFLIHTEKVGKLGVLDWIFNTPSNHRVHHASNPEYLDKNFGGVLMIYDHLFGTYIKETAAPVYGLTHNIDTHNPSKLLLDEFAKVAREFIQIKNFPEKFRYLFSRPQ